MARSTSPSAAANSASSPSSPVSGSSSTASADTEVSAWRPSMVSVPVGVMTVFFSGWRVSETVTSLVKSSTVKPASSWGRPAVASGAAPPPSLAPPSSLAEEPPASSNSAVSSEPHAARASAPTAARPKLRRPKRAVVVLCMVFPFIGMCCPP